MESKRLILSTRRHEDKDGDKLTPKGQLGSLYLGTNLIIPVGGISFYHSKAKRAKETAVYIAKGAKIKNPSTAYSKDLNSIAISKDYVNKAFMVDGKMDLGVGIDYMINNEIPEGEETLQNAGARIQTHNLKLIRTLPYQTSDEKRIESISHAPVVDGGLINILNLNGPKVESVSQIGGGFGVGENFEIIADYNSKSGTFRFDLQYRVGNEVQKLENIKLI